MPGGDAPAHLLLHSAHHLLQRQAGRVEQDGILGRHHRGDVAGGVAGVALVLRLENVVE